MGMEYYKVGQRVIGLRGIAKGKTGIIGATWQSGYGVTFPDSGNHNMKESSIMGLDEFPTIVELQAENERLRTAIQEALQIAREGEMSLNLCEDAKSLHFEAHMILEAILNTLPESEV